MRDVERWNNGGRVGGRLGWMLYGIRGGKWDIDISLAEWRSRVVALEQMPNSYLGALVCFRYAFIGHAFVRTDNQRNIPTKSPIR